GRKRKQQKTFSFAICEIRCKNGMFSQRTVLNKGLGACWNQLGMLGNGWGRLGMLGNEWASLGNDWEIVEKPRIRGLCGHGWNTGETRIRLRVSYSASQPDASARDNSRPSLTRRVVNGVLNLLTLNS